MDIMVEGPKSAQVADLLHERCIPYAVAIGDVGVLLDRERGGPTKSPKSSRGAAKRKHFELLLASTNFIFGYENFYIDYNIILELPISEYNIGYKLDIKKQS